MTDARSNWWRRQIATASNTSTCAETPDAAWAASSSLSSSAWRCRRNSIPVPFRRARHRQFRLRTDVLSSVRKLSAGSSARMAETALLSTHWSADHGVDEVDRRSRGIRRVISFEPRLTTSMTGCLLRNSPPASTPGWFWRVSSSETTGSQRGRWRTSSGMRARDDQPASASSRLRSPHRRRSRRRRRATTAAARRDARAG